MAEIEKGQGMIWPKFTRENPCPACNHFDWLCRMGERKFICMRVESPHPANDGGWYHDFDGKKPAYVPPAKKSHPKINAGKLIEKLSATEHQIESLAFKMGVSMESLRALGFVYSNISAEWAVPMFDGDGKPIGIQLRGESKKCITGSRLGLFIPQNVEPQKVCHICEGASDCAALLTMGFYAIGRPSCSTGAEQLKVALKRLGIHRAVIIADNDSLKVGDKRPGREGALRLQKDLKVPSCIFITPSPLKDVRELLKKVGVKDAAAIITSSVNQKVWVRIT